ncbi:MAG: FAD-dependent oxidoreductase [Chloroflexi bacterium]|nr:FAD-dependent oxidoreductase [Chloroflexota bacterium]
MMSGVQRSAKISAALAIGQYWPYPLLHGRAAYSIFVVDNPLCAADDALSEGMGAMSQTLTQHTVDNLRARRRGPVVAARDAEYEEVRKIWNAAIEKRPALFARCTGNEDIIAALQFARERDVELAVRSGGHNVAGTVLNGGLVIDLQLMRDINVDAERRRLRVQAGVRLGDVDRATVLYAAEQSREIYRSTVSGPPQPRMRSRRF